MAKISKSRGLKGQGRVKGIPDPGELDSQWGRLQEPGSWLGLRRGWGESVTAPYRLPSGHNQCAFLVRFTVRTKRTNVLICHLVQVSRFGLQGTALWAGHSLPSAE